LWKPHFSCNKRDSLQGNLSLMNYTESFTIDTFESIRRDYVQVYPVNFGWVDRYGQLQAGDLPAVGLRFNDACISAVQEALRWGESSVSQFENRFLLWGIPVMYNNDMTGGLVACVGAGTAFFKAFYQGRTEQIHEACSKLYELAVHYNVTNEAALLLQRRQCEFEQEHAYALHDSKQVSHASVLELYLREEPALFSAIRAGNRREARHILNKILVAIHYYAGDNIALIKGFFMELVAGMFRTAVESGDNPDELLGNNFLIIAKLSGAVNENELAGWLREALEQLMTVIEKSSGRNADSRLLKALDYMKRNCCKLPSREEVAQAASLSPSYFSALIKEHTNHSFSQLLNQFRTDEAAAMLRNTGKSISRVALETGFNDQSYFTKVFKEYQGETPRQYLLTSDSDSRGKEKNAACY
ncbi:MAG: helix-turn-helix transcriptional regulator, partial [Verrucomicrobiota bacterium]